MRGAIKGWKNMGVCAEKLWPFVEDDLLGGYTVERAKDARNTTLGAYFRRAPQISDYHAAINEAGALVVSANTHDGWTNVTAAKPRIAYDPAKPPKGAGGHAFAVVGYDADGFWIQNSWGKKWGKGGLALWTYEDWFDNVMDGWAVRLALSIPSLFGRVPHAVVMRDSALPVAAIPLPPRHEIMGNYVHVDDGKFVERGDYFSSADDVANTAGRIVESGNYQHVMIYAHGGLNSVPAAVKRVAAYKEPFKRNGIYPYSFVYDNGLCEELKDLVLREGEKSESRVGGFTDFSDLLIEKGSRGIGTALWDEMKRDATIAFDAGAGGDEAVRLLMAKLAGAPIRLHLVGHSTGAILLGNLLASLDRHVPGGYIVDSCILMAPACTVDFYEANFAPRLAGSRPTSLSRMTVYSLTDHDEQDDHVARIYRKSLLYLVSRVCERAKEMPLLGMQKHNRGVAHRNLEHVYAAPETRSESKSHGGFDNDPATMNDVLELILGKRPPKPFTLDELNRF
ncbi:MAG: C1 family peptidase [Alphaproteobacteria bacterium]|nr:C1 family peptidase [Alphaproteobacteria bacterium]